MSFLLILLFVSPIQAETDCVTITAPASIKNAVTNNPPGTTFCLQGTFNIRQPIRPKDNQSFIGPASIRPRGSVGFGFDLKGSDAVGVTLTNLDVGNFADNGVNCWTGTTVLGGRYHHNASNGIGCGLERTGPVVIDGAEIDHNGDPALLGQSSGGAKFARSGDPGVYVRNSYIHDNIGNGTWCDVQCLVFEVIDSTITGNTRKGIHFEKSGATDELGPLQQGHGYFARNTVLSNGGEQRNCCDSGITIISSKNVVIEDNVTGSNWRSGIRVRQDGRLDGEKHGWVIENVTIRNNMVPDGILGCEIAGVDCIGNT